MLARKALGQIEIKVHGIDYSLAATIPTRRAIKGFDMATTSTAKCKPLIEHSLRALFDYVDGRSSASGRDVDKALAYLTPTWMTRRNQVHRLLRASCGGISDIKAWDEKGNVLFKLGRFDESADYYSRFLEIYPSNVETWNKKGSCIFSTWRDTLKQLYVLTMHWLSTLEVHRHSMTKHARPSKLRKQITR